MTLYIYLGALLLLLASFSGNAILWRSRTNLIKQVGIEQGRTAAVAGERDQAVAAGAQCTASIEATVAAQAARDKKLQADLAAARKRMQELERQRLALLQRPPTVIAPKGAPPEVVREAACVSADDLNKAMLLERKQRRTP